MTEPTELDETAEATKNAEALTKRAAAIRAVLQTSLDASLCRDPNPTRQQASRDALWFFSSMTDEEIDHMRDRLNGFIRN